MFINLSPLKRNRNYRYYYLGTLISSVGSMVTYIALPYQVYQITHSSLAVGMIGTIELIPLLFTALLGGALADSINRKRLLILSEMGLALGTLVLAGNAWSATPKVWIIYLAAGIMSALNGFHRPALASIGPKLVHERDLSSVSALTTLSGLVGTIGGPALGGIIISAYGIKATYLVDFISFVISIWLVSLVKYPKQETQTTNPLSGIKLGLQYAWSRPELIGSYLVDFIAMIFGMPTALFPAISETLGGAKALGLLYAAPSAGAVLITLFSGWTNKVHKSGVAISLSALAWGFGIVAFGFSHHLWLAVFFLSLAGAADALSGIFRITLWNQTIPDKLRGRLAGVEMISYMSGPLLGNTESGLVAAAFGTRISVISGGFLCIIGVIGSVFLLPKFWRYKLPRLEH